MKPKHHIQLALLGVPFLLLSPATYAQDQEKVENAAEITEAEETEEIGNSRQAKETAERARETADHVREAAKLAGKTKETPEDRGNARSAEEAADRAERASERAEKAAERSQERVGRAKETAENGKETAERAREQAEEARERGRETAESAKERAEEARQSGNETAETAREHAREAAERGKETPENARERAQERAEEARESGKEAAENARERAKDARESGREAAENARERAKEARESGKETAESTRERARERVEEARESRKETAENARERAEEARESEKETAENARERAEEAPDPKITEIPASEPERLAETQVTEVTREVHRDIDQRKTRIEGQEDARALIDDILGAESRISRAEIAREERFRPRFERQRPGGERIIEVTPDQRREATTYFQQRLRGREIEGPPPEFFRRSEFRGDRRDNRVVERVEYVRPRYFNEGRRYVHYDSRAAIPAILMAAQAMNHVRFQPTREIAPMFYERQEVSAPYAMPLPPENYRGQDSVVVSYPVDEQSMISSEDILFLQGSTQFSDPYSYEVIGVMADAMKAMPEEERFVIEGHASAEGSYESNMVLSQQRAEHIVREIVRRGGVSPYRLLPVGYGESEARHSADAAEHLRGQDRRVVVFRMKSEPIAQR